MITVLKPTATEKQRSSLISWLENQGLEVHISKGKNYTVLGLVGDTSRIDVQLLESLEMVNSVKRVSDPFKQCSRMFHPENSVIDVNGVKIGDGNFCLIAGPCSVENHDQIIDIAKNVKSAGASILRGGAFKPRTSPYDFQGLKADGITLLSEAKKITGMPVLSEIMNINQLPLFDDVDMIQVGARNMQNFDLLKELGKTKKPILLKRGLANTIKELLMSAEYIMAGGNENIVLCERGIRTFETYTRNTLDLSAVPVIKELTHLPVIVDPSHATGNAKYVEPMALAAAACGADGIMIEVHNNPMCALCDGAQSVTPEEFEKISKKIKSIKEVLAE